MWACPIAHKDAGPISPQSCPPPSQKKKKGIGEEQLRS